MEKILNDIENKLKIGDIKEFSGLNLNNDEYKKIGVIIDKKSDYIEIVSEFGDTEKLYFPFSYKSVKLPSDVRAVYNNIADKYVQISKYNEKILKLRKEIRESNIELKKRQNIISSEEFLNILNQEFPKKFRELLGEKGYSISIWDKLENADLSDSVCIRLYKLEKLSEDECRDVCQFSIMGNIMTVYKNSNYELLRHQYSKKNTLISFVDNDIYRVIDDKGVLTVNPNGYMDMGRPSLYKVDSLTYSHNIFYIVKGNQTKEMAVRLSKILSKTVKL